MHLKKLNVLFKTKMNMLLCSVYTKCLKGLVGAFVGIPFCCKLIANVGGKRILFEPYTQKY